MVAVEQKNNVIANDGRTKIAVENPITGEIIGQVPQFTAEDVAEAVERARAAQPAWNALGVKERVKLFLRWTDLVWQRQQELIDTIRRETGKPDAMALNEVIVLDATVAYYYHHAPSILQEHRRKPLIPLVHRASVAYRPHGVVGVISPWNFPYHLPMVDSIPALIAGNTVVLKPSEITPYSAELALKWMYEVGIPRDVFQIVHGNGQVGAALVEEVDYVAFTGSAAVGRKIATRAGERLIPFSLELGGKHPLIFLKDADIEFSVTSMIKGAFGNSGHFCMAVTRAYIEAPIYDHVIERTLHWIKEYRVNAETTAHMGSLTNEREMLKVEAHIADAVAKGAKVLYGGKRRPDLGPLFYEPTILVDVDHSMLVMREETFGPLLPIMKVQNEQEAIRLANDSDYAFTASVFTKDLKHGQAVGRQIRCGDVCVNVPQMVIGTPSLPSGGNNTSGMGRRNGREGLLRFVTPQSMIVNTGLMQAPTLDLIDNQTITVVKILRAIGRYIPMV